MYVEDLFISLGFYFIFIVYTIIDAGLPYPCSPSLWPSTTLLSVSMGYAYMVFG